MEKHYPDFIKKVDKEIKDANQRARKEVPKKEIIKEPLPYVRPRDTAYRNSFDAQNPTVSVVAELVLEGKNKQEISELTGLKINTIQNYSTVARKAGMIPPGLIIPDK